MTVSRRACPSRRRFVQSLAGAALFPMIARGVLAAAPGGDHGRINPPVPAPDLKLVRHDGISTTLFDLMNHRITAVQLMFTSCTTTCPIQGAIFARVQKLIPDQVRRGIQLVSLSVDPAHDTPAVLKAWLRKFSSRPGWVAAAPELVDVERLRDFAGRGRNPSDNHSTQIQLFNREAQLVWRTGELPAAEEIAALLRASKA